MVNAQVQENEYVLPVQSRYETAPKELYTLLSLQADAALRGEYTKAEKFYKLGIKKLKEMTPDLNKSFAGNIASAFSSTQKNAGQLRTIEENKQETEAIIAAYNEKCTPEYREQLYIRNKTNLEDKMGLAQQNKESVSKELTELNETIIGYSRNIFTKMKYSNELRSLRKEAKKLETDWFNYNKEIRQYEKEISNLSQETIQAPIQTEETRTYHGLLKEYETTAEIKRRNLRQILRTALSSSL